MQVNFKAIIPLNPCNSVSYIGFPLFHTSVAEESIDQDNLTERLEKSLQLQDSPNTVTSRALLAQEYVKSCTELTRICESLINDQVIRALNRVGVSHLRL